MELHCQESANPPLSPPRLEDSDQRPLDWENLEEVYDELRRIARFFMHHEHNADMLQTTALVHEAYLRLFREGNSTELELRRFFIAAARAMRAVLIDHARRRRALKRSGGGARVPLDTVVSAYEDRALDLIVLDEALHRLARVDPELTKLVELRFYGGLGESESAQVLGVSVRSVRRAWRVAKMWLRKDLGHE